MATESLLHIKHSIGAEVRKFSGDVVVGKKFAACEGVFEAGGEWYVVGVGCEGVGGIFTSRGFVSTS